MEYKKPYTHPLDDGGVPRRLRVSQVSPLFFFFFKKRFIIFFPKKWLVNSKKERCKSTRDIYEHSHTQNLYHQ